ncbi:MAG: hypothetical protein ACFFA5_02070 [Promethearchaeota archaeon]
MGVSSYFSGRKIIVYIITAFVAWFAWLDNIIDYLYFLGLYADTWPYYDVFTFPDFAYNVTLALPLIVFVMTLLPEAEKWKNILRTMGIIVLITALLMLVSTINLVLYRPFITAIVLIVIAGIFALLNYPLKDKTFWEHEPWQWAVNWFACGVFFALIGFLLPPAVFTGSLEYPVLIGPYVWALVFAVGGILALILGFIMPVETGLVEGLIVGLFGAIGTLLGLWLFFWDTEVIPPDGWYIQILVLFIVSGFAGGFFNQFNFTKYIMNSFQDFIKMKLVLALWIVALLGALVSYFAIAIYFPGGVQNIVLRQVLIFLVPSLIVTPIAFRSAHFWQGLLIGITTSLSYFSVIIQGDPSLEIIGLIGFPFVPLIRYAPPQISIYVVNGLLLVLAALWGGLWGSVGNYFTMAYTEIPEEGDVAKRFRTSYLFRDLWSNYFIHGKNVEPEFEKTEQFKLDLDKILDIDFDLKQTDLPRFGEYVSFRYMDRSKHWETVPKPLKTIGVQPIEDTDKARVEYNNKHIGDFYDPKVLADKYSPVWSPMNLVFQRTLVTAMRPIIYVLLVITLILVGYSIYVNFTVIGGGIEFLGLAGAQIVVLIFLFFFMFKWYGLFEQTVNERPEASSSFLIVALIIVVIMLYITYTVNSLGTFIVTEANEDLIRFETNGLYIMLLINFILGIGSVQVLGSENMNLYWYDKRPEVFPMQSQEDAPVWLKGDQYWVFRNLFWWPFELTVGSKGLEHEDWERIELWVNANTGKPEWIISDYHWRELWYRVPELDEEIMIKVTFATNFHTPIPSVLRKATYDKFVAQFEGAGAASAVIKYAIGAAKSGIGRAFDSIGSSLGLKTKGEKERDAKTTDGMKARTKVLGKYFVDVGGPAKGICGKQMAATDFNFFRYPYGCASTKDIGTGGAIDIKYYYREKDFVPPIKEPGTGFNLKAEKKDGLGYKISVDETAPQLCMDCGEPYNVMETVICPACGSNNEAAYRMPIE